MRNINTMTISQYIWRHAWWGSLSMIWFRVLMFRTVGSLSLTQSKNLLWFLAIFLVSIGIMATFKKRRNYISLIINLAIPYEVYTLYTYWNILTWQLYIGLSFAVLLSSVYMYMIFSRRITNSQKKNHIIINRIKRSILGVRTITSFCLLIAVISIASSTLFGFSLTKSKIEPIVNENFESWTIANNIEHVAMFYEETWEDLSSEEKTAALQVVANIECRYLGLPHELTLATVRLPENTLAAYDDRTHTILVNIDHFEASDSSEILESVCHEAYHAYQYRLVDAYDSLDNEHKKLLAFYNASVYKEEFASYVDGDEDYLEYYFQTCEISARLYANTAAEEYFDRIYEYLGTSDGSVEN